MTDPSRECRAVQPLLREHALGLLSEQEARRIDAHVAVCDACHAALEAERAALSVLDSLPDVSAPVGLAERTLRHVRAAEAAKETRSPFAFRRSLLEFAAACCTLLVIAALVLPALGRAREAARRSSCPNNLKQMGLVFKMYANEHGGAYPPLVSVDGTWVVDLRAIYPEYLTDPTILLCPSAPERPELQPLKEALSQSPPDWDRAHRLIASQYVYLGWVIRNEQDFLRLLTFPHAAPGTDLKWGEEILHWLRDGVEKNFVEEKDNPADAAKQQSRIPVMFDNPATTPHSPKGIHVLYLDGHVDFLLSGTGFPATPGVLRHFTDCFGKK